MGLFFIQNNVQIARFPEFTNRLYLGRVTYHSTSRLEFVLHRFYCVLCHTTARIFDNSRTEAMFNWVKCCWTCNESAHCIMNFSPLLKYKTAKFFSFVFLLWGKVRIFFSTDEKQEPWSVLMAVLLRSHNHISNGCNWWITCQREQMCCNGQATGEGVRQELGRGRVMWCSHNGKRTIVILQGHFAEAVSLMCFFLSGIPMQWHWRGGGVIFWPGPEWFSRYLMQGLSVFSATPCMHTQQLHSVISESTRNMCSQGLQSHSIDNSLLFGTPCL